MEKLIEFFAGIKQSKYWPFVKWVIIALAFVLVFFCGMYSRPAKVQVEQIDKIRYQERVVVETQIEEKIVYVKQEAEEKIRVVYRETKPDGTKVEREEERTKKDSTTKEDTSRSEDTKRISELTAERDSLKRRIETSQPRVMFGVAVGYDASPSWLRVPTAPNLSIGIEAKVRVIGPVWVGAAAYSTGLVAGTVSVSF